MKLSILFFVFLMCSESVKSAKILLVYPIPSPSHGILGETFAKALSNKGHEITFMSPYKMKQEYPNCRHIVMDEVVEKVDRFIAAFQANKKHSFFAELTEFQEIVATISEAALESQAFKNLLKSDEHYDLVMLDSFFNEAHFGLAHFFKAPLILTSATISVTVNHLTGNIAPFSFVPNLVSEFSDNMSFFNRVENTVSGVLSMFMHNLILFPKQEEIYNKYFYKGPSLKELVDNITVILINTQPVLETPRPYMPNMIYIGGFHVQEPKKLPQDIQMYLDSATDGAIYVSLGSNIKSADLPKNTINAFIETFKKLPYKVIWKFESDNLENQPENVMIKKWFQQQDILAHPNIKLFVSHAGLLSLTETMVRGVPVLVIPFFGDQPSNAANVVEYGYGVKLLPENISEESLTASITEVLNNPRYAMEMKYRSKALNDLPQKPLDTAIYWVEHVLKHEGGRYLRSPARKLKTYQYLLVDVFAFCSVILITLISGLYFGIKFCCSAKRKEAITKGTGKKSVEKTE